MTLDVLHVLVTHELLLERFGGIAGITEQGFGKLEAALAAPHISMFGNELYPGIAEKAGILFFRLVRSHAFSDGNKRVALVILLDWLKQHDLELAASEDELYEWVLDAASTASREDVTEWIAARLQGQTNL